MSETVKAKAPKKGKGSAVLIRVTQETRAALEQETERTGRSLSQVAEMWLEEARQGRASLLKFCGGPILAGVVAQLIEIAESVEERNGDRDAWYRREALLAAWREALPHLLPPAPEVDVHRVRHSETELSGLCYLALEALRSAADDDPVRRRATLPVDERAPLGAPSVAHVLQACADRSANWSGVREALAALRCESSPHAAVIEAAIQQADQLRTALRQREEYVRLIHGAGASLVRERFARLADVGE